MAGHTLQIDPESELVFTLSPNEATPRCSMTLRHGGGTEEFIAFKVGAIHYTTGYVKIAFIWDPS